MLSKMHTCLCHSSPGHFFENFHYHGVKFTWQGIILLRNIGGMLKMNDPGSM